MSERHARCQSGLRCYCRAGMAGDHDAVPRRHTRDAGHGLSRAAVAQSIRAPASFTISAHLAISSARKVENSCGEPGFAMALNFSRLVLVSAVSRPLLMAALSFAMTAGGVPTGATTPVQASMT